MSKRIHLRMALWLGLALMVPGLMRCQCDPPPDCLVPTDCVEFTWNNSECDQADGHWECLNASCVGVCGDLVCTYNADCTIEQWPSDAGCQSGEGYWECREQECVAVCHGAECAQDSECSANTWPSDAGCEETDGHWECQASNCVAVCQQQECTSADDCSSNSWPDEECAEADGHWECQGGDCVAVCDEQQCSQSTDCSANTWPSDVGCVEADGHWECTQGDCVAVCDSQCTTYDDCDEQQWPIDADCELAHGHWECQDGDCVAVCNTQCDDPAACGSVEWGLDCSGHWNCVQGLCDEVCDEVGCGDTECDEAGGETVGSCPDDCGITCSLPIDCVGEQWVLPCNGRWECQDSACVGVCDYTTCGDGTCDLENGEISSSCPSDCMTNCQLPIDCVHNTWTQICQGLWSCYMGQCKQVCESNSCGDGVCAPTMGETSTSCFEDCNAGACEQVTDCLGIPWLVDCDGNWVCDEASNSCLEDCTDTDCGDGTCYVLAGEDTGSCGSDCADYSCLLSSDCSDLTLPASCTGWLCVNQVCVPTCP